MRKKLKVFNHLLRVLLILGMSSFTPSSVLSAWSKPNLKRAIILSNWENSLDQQALTVPDSGFQAPFISERQVTVQLTSMHCEKITKEGSMPVIGSNDRDEVYILSSGIRVRNGQIFPIEEKKFEGKSNTDRDRGYFGMRKGRIKFDPQHDKYGIAELRTISISPGEIIQFTVAVSEQDNAQKKAMETTALAAGYAAAAAIAALTKQYGVAKELAKRAQKEGESAAWELLKSLGRKGDQFIGGFTVAILCDRNGQIRVCWHDIETSVIDEQELVDGNDAVFTLQEAGRYHLAARVI